MSVKPEGPCTVCGVVTSNRCSGCSSASDLSVFFCSPSHQKLVWFAHKRVCGKRSKPFQLPLLSLDEAELAKRKLYEHDERETQDMRTMAAALKKWVVKDSGTVIIDNVTKGAKPRYSATTTVDILAAIRHYSNKLPTSEQLASEGEGSPVQDDVPPTIFLRSIEPLSIASYFIVAYWDLSFMMEQGILAGIGHPDDLDPTRSGWNCQLLHQIVVVSALDYLKHQKKLSSSSPNDEKTDEIEQLRRKAAKVVENLVIDIIRKKGILAIGFATIFGALLKLPCFEKGDLVPDVEAMLGKDFAREHGMERKQEEM